MQTDVIIIGAGSAGLSAAKELTKQGISFIVVEASHRVCGELILTRDESGFDTV